MITDHVITVDGSCVMRQTSLRACRINLHGRIFHVPRVYRWAFVMQHRIPGRRDPQLRCYELSVN